MAGGIRVVVVPGIGGTQLSYKGGSGGKTALWYSPGPLTRNTPLALGLASDGVSPAPGVGKLLFPDGVVQLGIYEPLLNFLNVAAYTPAFFSYDWRLDINQTALAFFSYLQTLPLANPFYVVAHSMGGLIAQLAYPIWNAAGNVPKWQTTAYLGTPMGGAHWATLCLNGVFLSSSWFAALAALFSFVTATNIITKVGASLLQQAVGSTLGSWPSVYQLLPSNLGAWAGLDPLAGIALILASYTNGPGGVQQQWLTLARTTQSNLIATRGLPLPTEFVLIGDGSSTPNTFAGVIQSGALSDVNWSNAGDGTVVQSRAAYPGQIAALFAGATHNSLLSSATMLEKLIAYLATPPVVVPPELTVSPKPLGASVPPPTPKLSTIPLYADTFVNKHGDP